MLVAPSTHSRLTALLLDQMAVPRHYRSGWDEQPFEARRDDETGFKRVRDGAGLKRERGFRRAGDVKTRGPGCGRKRCYAASLHS